MATSTRPNPKKTDRYGIERVTEDDPGFVDKMRMKHEWFDHVMRMQERYSQEGGNHFAAGVTYFSVLSVFPLLMLAFAIIGFVLRGNDELMRTIENAITENLDGQMGETVSSIIDSAVGQAGGVFTVGFVTALWSGLSWMGNLRMGVTALWKRPILAENFILGKLRDLLRLLGMMLMIALTFAVTAIGSSGLTSSLVEKVGLDGIPGIGIFTAVVAIVLGLIANWILFFWMLASLPRGKVPMKPAAQGAVIGAIGLEVVKQLGSLFFSNALSNPAGAVFGPIIGLMVVFYLIWRITMYASAWTATTEEALAMEEPDAPPPAVINIRPEAAREPRSLARLMRM
ncbi:YhjD/YihY/BrkB family envelope integrity protein [Corynebacterium hansenii]|uniref:YhjD/YihY/BrkB family envelope integrity protein n=1 Tax=Corynebacterium hansenii TaxID=394964 RepID=A0ABV7ZLA9_9CORY|nr:YhjD/YihY/BrkB family envelope integrity protein [Corynebacterium hansenii]WJY99117.1 Inner membrane protein YhjD [Corynebacterium hansenii]